MGVDRMLKWMNAVFGSCTGSKKEAQRPTTVRRQRNDSDGKNDTDARVVTVGEKRVLKRKQSLYLAPNTDLSFQAEPAVKRDEDILVHYGWKLCWFIGEGAMSKVRSAERISDGQRAAVKVIDKRTLSEKVLSHHLPNEKKIMTQIDNPHVVKTFDLVETQHKLYIFMELMERGDMYNMIEKLQRLTSSETKLYFRQLVLGVKYLHDSGIAHRDLKLENVLLNKERHLKVTDFGFSRFSDAVELCDTVCGTPGYCAPEVYRGEPYNAVKADLYALGVCLFIMSCGKYPFDRELTVHTVVDKQMSRDFNIPPTVKCLLHADAVRIIHELMAPNPEERISLEDILNSDWLKQES